MKLYSVFAIAAHVHDPAITRIVVGHINSKLRPKRKLPFVVYFSVDSTPTKLIFRIEHHCGTANKVVVTSKYVAVGRHTRRQLNFDASDGSNWHHLKWDFMQWFKATLLEDSPEHLLEKLLAVAPE